MANVPGASHESDAFESAVARLPYPVFIVDGERHLHPLNDRGRRFAAKEQLAAATREPHSLFKVIDDIRRGQPDEEIGILELNDGSRWEVIHSSISSKGAERWLLLMLRPFAAALIVKRAAVQAKWNLTPREAEIATACLEGQSTTQICEALSMSRETFKTHMNRILSKAGCEKRSQLLAAFLFD